MTKKYFNTKRIVMLAMLAAMGFALSLLETPPIFQPYWRLDFSNLATMLGGYLFGPVSAIIIEGVKQLLAFAVRPTFGGSGELANFLMTSAFVLFPSILYKFRKGRVSVVIGMFVGCVMQIGAALLCNRFIIFPIAFDSWETAVTTFNAVWPLMIAFNAIKTVSVSILTFLLYKRLSKAMKWVFGEQKTLAKRAGAVYNNTMQKKTVTEGADETVALAERLAATFKGGETVLLTGDLGAGKTVFAKGVARALGVQTDVKSPTFTLCCEYEGDKLRLVHIDAYRLKDGAEAEACGLNEKFGDKGTVCLIEWPSQIASVLPAKAIKVNIERLSDNEREITIDADF